MVMSVREIETTWYVCMYACVYAYVCVYRWVKPLGMKHVDSIMVMSIREIEAMDRMGLVLPCMHQVSL